MVDPQGPSAVGGAPLFGGLNTTVSGSMTKQKPLLFPSVPNAPAYLRRLPTKAEVPADLIAAPRLERLSRMACASGSALHSVRLQWAAHLAVHYAWNRMGHEG